MMILVYSILLQMNPGRSRFAFPYDTTQGVPKWFYFLSGTILLIVVIGVAKAFWDDQEWRGKFFDLFKKEEK